MYEGSGAPISSTMLGPAITIHPAECPLITLWFKLQLPNHYWFPALFHLVTGYELSNQHSCPLFNQVASTVKGL